MNSELAPWPHFDADVISKVTALLTSGRVNYWTGDEGQKFEREISDFIGTKHAIAVANGTVALELCLEALQIGAHYGGTILDEVIVTPRSFVASASAIKRAGARVIFADVDPISQNIAPRSIRSRITEYTRAVIAVHLAGWPCDMHGIRKLTETRNIAVIEDCAQAHGARIESQSVGRFGDLAAWSFCQDKIISTGGEGGMVTTQRTDLAERIWALKDHGKSRVKMRTPATGAFRYVHDQIGTNARMTEVSATIGRHQLLHLPDWTRVRNENAAQIETALEGYSDSDGPIRLTRFDPQLGTHARYKYYAFIRPENLKPGFDRDVLIHHFVQAGVPVQSGICPEIYREGAFQKTYRGPRLPIARLLGDTSLMFPVHPTLRKRDLAKIKGAIHTILARATKTRLHRIA